MDGPRLTEERLRNHLDSNQVMRERMCLALMPLLGPYSRERPRRPKGGPDGGRDLEAIHQGETPVWGAVGFKNGGGSDDGARDDAEKKYRADLDRALEENPSLIGFVFFTNVDLTPGRIENLKASAQQRKIKIIEIFDMERLRHALDSPEGLIARLQYLEIPMSPTEQLSLVAKFGNQLQNAVTSRFDRVEQTLAQMERFLDLQKPLLRLDFFLTFVTPTTSAQIGDEAVLIRIHGLTDLSKTFACLCVNYVGLPHSGVTLVASIHLWNEESPSVVLSLRPSIGTPSMMTSFCEVSIKSLGQPVRISDLTVIGVEAYCTEGFRGRIAQISVDANGYELFSCPTDGLGETATLNWPAELTYPAASRIWVRIVKQTQRNLLFTPVRPSGRFEPLQIVEKR